MNAFQQQIVGSFIGFLIAELIVYSVKKLCDKKERIIHCKDCKKWKTPYCPFYARYTTVMPNEKQYCSLAERK